MYYCLITRGIFNPKEASNACLSVQLKFGLSVMFDFKALFTRNVCVNININFNVVFMMTEMQMQQMSLIFPLCLCICVTIKAHLY